MPKDSVQGLSLTCLVIIALRNSDTHINDPKTFWTTAISLKDIYRFLREHVKCFRNLKPRQADHKATTLRFALSQTNFCCKYRFLPGGRGEMIPRSTVGVRGQKKTLGVWTICSPLEDGYVEKKTRKRIEKLFRPRHVVEFKKFLVNPNILDALLSGEWGWRDANAKPLPTSEARMRQREANDAVRAAPVRAERRLGEAAGSGNVEAFADALYHVPRASYYAHTDSDFRDCTPPADDDEFEQIIRVLTQFC